MAYEPSEINAIEEFIIKLRENYYESWEKEARWNQEKLRENFEKQILKTLIQMLK